MKCAAKLAAFVVCALCAFAVLSCGGGGGGGGVAAASSSGPWGSKTTITIPFTKGDTSRAGFSEGFKRLDWESISFTVTQIANGKSEVIFEETIDEEKNITIEVITGSKIEATAVITMKEGAGEPRTATGVIERVEPGKNTLTLHVPYTANIMVSMYTSQDVPYNSKDGLKLDDFYVTSDGLYLYQLKEYKDTDTGKLYAPGIHHDITGDVKLYTPIWMEFDRGDMGYVLTYYSDPESTVTIPATVGGNAIYAIGNNSFSNNTAIEHVYIKSGIELIETAFNGCTNLKTVEIPNSIETIGESAFDSCGALQAVTIPNSVRSIGPNAFSGTGITSLNLSNGLERIGPYAFNECAGLQSVTIPSSVQTVSNGAFYKTGLTEVVIEYGVESIGSSAFGYTALQTVTVPDSVTSIGANAFILCTDLETVYMPVFTSGNIALGTIFLSCSGLTDIFFTTDDPPTSVTTDGLNKANITIHYPNSGEPSAWETVFDTTQFAGVEPYQL